MSAPTGTPFKLIVIYGALLIFILGGIGLYRQYDRAYGQKTGKDGIRRLRRPPYRKK